MLTACKATDSTSVRKSHHSPGNEHADMGADVSSGDVGGQKTLRSYWRNYFEKTDALIWVVDATDRMRMGDCREELVSLLVQEVRLSPNGERRTNLISEQRLMGASLLIFSNKTDVDGCMNEEEIRSVIECR